MGGGAVRLALLHVRFTPESGHWDSAAKCLLCALRAMMLHDFRCADDLPEAISHWRYCQRNHHKTCIFALAHSFKVVDAFAVADSVQNFNFLIQAIRWDQDCNWLADNLFGRIPEKALRCLVPGSNRTVEVFANDSIIARLLPRL